MKSLTAKKKTTTSVTSASFFKFHNNKTKIKGLTESDLDGGEFMSDVEKTLKRKEKLKGLLLRAKAAGDKDLVATLEEELGIKSDNKGATDEEKNKKIDEAIAQYNILLQNTELPDKLANRYVLMINTLISQKTGTNSNQYLNQALMLQQPRSSAPDQSTQLQTMMFDFMKNLISTKKEETLSPMEQFEKFEKMIAERQPSLKEQLQDAKEIMQATGGYVDGNTTLEQLKLKVDMDKTDKEYIFRGKELEAKQAQTSAIMDLGQEITSALITGLVDSLTDDEEPAPKDSTSNLREAYEKQQKEKTAKQKPEDSEIHLEERNSSDEIYFIDCKRCEQAFKILHPDQSREVACSNCSWPHYYYIDSTGKRKYVGPDPNDEKLGGDPDKWLAVYKPGTIEQTMKAELLKQENKQSI